LGPSQINRISQEFAIYRTHATLINSAQPLFITKNDRFKISEEMDGSIFFSFLVYSPSVRKCGVQ